MSVSAAISTALALRREGLSGSEIEAALAGKPFRFSRGEIVEAAYELRRQRDETAALVARPPTDGGEIERVRAAMAAAGYEEVTVAALSDELDVGDVIVVEVGVLKSDIVVTRWRRTR